MNPWHTPVYFDPGMTGDVQVVIEFRWIISHDVSVIGPETIIFRTNCTSLWNVLLQISLSTESYEN